MNPVFLSIWIVACSGKVDGIGAEELPELFIVDEDTLKIIEELRSL